MRTETLLTPLRALALEPGYRDASLILGYTAQGALHWRDMNGLIAAWRQRIAALPCRFVLVRLEQGHDLLACLLALWQLNRVAVLASQSPANLGLELVAADHLDDSILGINATPTEVADDTALLLFTSGSSGTPSAVVKTFLQLDTELALLEACWGQRVEDSVFATTVSRHHMYGLPFSLLWPVVRGSPFYSDTIHYSQSLELLCQRFPLTLISSPVQLDHLPDNLDWPLLRTGLRAIFSAGAPLPLRAAQLCRDRLTPAVEIYGSTETGAAAWRDQTSDIHWQCLPGIAVAATADGGLRIHSPCLDGDGTLEVADRAEILSPQRFSLLGRADRIAKVAGKRISLVDVENRLLSHPWVAAVRTTLLDDRKGRIGAVVVLNGEGRSLLIDRGRNAINRLLADHISPDLEPVAIPRYWRYVGRLPITPQGKVTEELLHSLFYHERQPRLPEVLEQQLSDNAASLVLRIPDNLFYFSGHFPGNPVLPGVVQINWAEHFGRRFFPGLDRFQRVETLKFQHIIQPGDVVALALNWEADKSRLLFSFGTAHAQHSSGRLVYGNGDD